VAGLLGKWSAGRALTRRRHDDSDCRRSIAIELLVALEQKLGAG
jgi:hypothetical protein